MNEVLNLRRARKSDARLLSKIRYESILALASPSMGTEGARTWAESSMDNRVLSAIENHEVWVVTDSEEAIGWVEIDENVVKGLYVDPSFSGRGTGTYLLLRAEERIVSSGYATSRLDSSLNAEGFYLHRGYQPTSERTPDVGWPMEKQL